MEKELNGTSQQARKKKYQVINIHKPRLSFNLSLCGTVPRRVQFREILHKKYA